MSNLPLIDRGVGHYMAQLPPVLDSLTGVKSEKLLQQFPALKNDQTVELVLETHQTTWASLPAFVRAAGEFTTIIPDIQSLAQIQTSREGAANEKAYALEGRVDFSPSTIVYGRESAVLARAQDIHAAATASLASLADYGITQAKLTAFKKKIEAFESSLGKPRQQIANNGAATTTLSQQFSEADTILSKRLDKLVFQFKESAPDFFNANQTARSIVGLRGRKTNDTPAPVPAPA